MPTNTLAGPQNVPMPTEKAREQIVDDLRRFLVGPVQEDERFQESALDRYHTGFLSPSGTPIDPEEDDQEAVDEELDAGAGESILALANVSQQSAMGMTFQVQASDSPLGLTIHWAEYLPERREGEADGSVPVTWCRQARQLALPLSVMNPSPTPQILAQQDNIRVYAIIRANGATRTITVSVVNARPSNRRAGFDSRVYQVSMRAKSSTCEPVFLPRPPAPHLLDSKELWNFELLYRNRCQFAVGHGCSVGWQANPDGRHAVEIWTEWIPTAEVFKASAAVLADDPILELDSLSDENKRSEVCHALQRVADAYVSWIALRQGEIPGILDHFPADHHGRIQEVAADNLTDCKRACDRIREGVEVLRTDDVAWKAFVLANQAMARSMRQASATRQPPRADTPRWFAFQLAFILLSLPSSARPAHPDRRTLDLIWFPTGGGKTEAYLGLSAFCLFHRRLAGRTQAERQGTVVLSRYTLRLLTVQQLERAARVVFACELIRREQPTLLGAVAFSIGLFVGGGATPNRMEEAARILRNEADEGSKATTLPLSACPWCRTRLERHRQHIHDAQLLTPCPNAQCPFHERLPLAVVDDEIYDHPPSMVIGTIDKFARMAWVPEIRSLFGRGAIPGSPPTLIIQDELHLISDSLGTIAALYETAIDHLCTIEGCPPKVVGSTATIRRAQEQCRLLFDREAAQFPPSGTLASDSFFYTEDRSQPGRLYAGVHAQGRSPKHSLAWVVGTICQGATSERISDLRVRDSFHTLVLYFNSMRELGGALVLAADDVPAYTSRLCRLQGRRRRDILHIQELSSQLKSDQIRDVLAQMETSLVPTGGVPTTEPLDLLLSTNMISVGVDVDRLGVMMVNGQPKTTSEYIQASSRVGRPRGSAGLVVTLYNWTRPRDRSHYERFVAYHETFYRFVESTSVTPFSERARDRALHAVLVSLARLVIDRFAPKDSAGEIIRSPQILAEVRHLADVIVARAQAVDASEALDTRAHLDDLIAEWQDEATARQLQWSRHPRATGSALLRPAEWDNPVYGLWPTPQSMRDVDPAAPVLLLTSRQLDR